MVGLAENKATQPSLAGAWAELGNNDPINTKIFEFQPYVHFLKIFYTKLSECEAKQSSLCWCQGHV